MSTKVAMATGPFQDGVGCGNWARAVASWPGQATVRTVAGCSPGWAALTARGRAGGTVSARLTFSESTMQRLTLDGGQSERGVPPRLVNVRLPGPVPVCAWAGCGLVDLADWFDSGDARASGRSS